MGVSGYADPSYGTESYGSGGLFFGGSHGMPLCSCWVSFTTNPGDTPVWENVSAYLRAFSVKRGRQYELDQFTAGTATITLDNRARTFDPNYNESPYYPNVVPMRRVKLTATWGAEYVVFDGYVDAWPQSYNKPNEARVDVTATDAFKVLSLTKLPGSVYEYEVRQDNPAHWWRMGEKQGALALDSGSTPTTGSLNGVMNYTTTGSSPFDSDTAIGFVDPNADGGGYFSAPVSILSGDFTIELWTDTTLEIGIPLFQATPGNTNKMSGRAIDWQISTDGLTVVDGLGNFVRQDARAHFVTASGTLSSSYFTSFAAAGWHHIVVTRSGSTVTLYLDGVSRATGTNAATFAGGVLIGPTDIYAAGLVIGLDEVALYTSALSAARVAAHYSAAIQAWTGETSDARITRALNATGFSSASRSLEAGIATLGSAVLNNQTVTEHAQEVEFAEAGAFFFAADGTAKFYNRHHLITEPGLTPQATFGDAAGELPYTDIVVGYDDTHIINEARVTRAGGTTQIASDATSQAKYLKRTLDQSDVHTQTDTDSLYRSQDIVSRFKNPAVRIESIEIKPQRDPTDLWPLVLSLDIDDVIRIHRRPQGISLHYISTVNAIESVEHTVTPEMWVTKYQLGTVPPAAGVLDNAIYGLLDASARVVY